MVHPLRRRGYLGIAVLALISVLLVLPGRPQRATAQGIAPSRQVAEQIYAQLPGLPLENYYERAGTNDVDESNTLISRFVRYHLFVQRRQPIYRLDWKLTLADYLGVNEWVLESAYPGFAELDGSPRNADMTAVRSLTLSQRQALVEALVAIYRPN